MVGSRCYAWILLLSAADVIVTWFVLELGGAEVNHIAAAVLEWGGLPGILTYKLALVTLSILACEEVARRKRRTGIRLGVLLAVLASVPLIAVAAQAATAYVLGF